jgi:succinate dehydrogenase/fumarate reductase flavoprotein subunit
MNHNTTTTAPDSGDWELWWHSTVKGSDYRVDAGAEPDMRKRMDELAAQGSKVWLVAPDGATHEPAGA